MPRKQGNKKTQEVKIESQSPPSEEEDELPKDSTFHFIQKEEGKTIAYPS